MNAIEDTTHRPTCDDLLCGYQLPPHAVCIRFPKPSGCTSDNGADVCQARSPMRDPEIIETELMEISAIAEDSVKLERIVVWCAAHADEVPFALHQLMGRRDKYSSET